MRLVAGVLLAGALVFAGNASGSIFVASNASRVALRVDAKGNAEVSWYEGKSRKTVIVPAKGQLFHGGSLTGPDVSRAATVPGLSPARVVRRTPDGTLWALQDWQPRAGELRELHLARWKGEATKLTLKLDGTRLSGRATFAGRPVTGFSLTLEGKRPRIYIFLDCLGCQIARPGIWARMLGVAPRSDGTFSVSLKPAWQKGRYRATLIGPNVGTAFAPNAAAFTSR